MPVKCELMNYLWGLPFPDYNRPLVKLEVCIRQLINS